MSAPSCCPFAPPPAVLQRPEYKLSRSSGTITARLLKSTDPDFPCDLDPPLGLGLLQKQQQVSQLSALPPHLDEGRWGYWMVEMFTQAQSVAMVRWLRCLTDSATQASLPSRSSYMRVAVSFPRAHVRCACAQQQQCQSLAVAASLPPGKAGGCCGCVARTGWTLGHKICTHDLLLFVTSCLCTDVQVREPISALLGDPFYDLRETLKFLFVHTFRGETVFRVGWCGCVIAAARVLFVSAAVSPASMLAVIALKRVHVQD